MQKYIRSLASSSIDLHPHQIDAAVFAHRACFSEGVMIADEHTLGKRVTAGIILLQERIESQKPLIVLCKQEHSKRWKVQLTKKFGLDICSIEDKEQYQESIVVLSYSEMSTYKQILSHIDWGLIVFDSAHELIAGYHSGNRPENEIGALCRGKKKILLTATPMKNSLIDLYHLVHILDPTLFGGSEVLFKKKYIAHSNAHNELVQRAQMLCQRTLRRQVKTMQFTKRIVKTMLIPPSQEEVKLSTKMSAYFHRDVLLAFPKIKEVYIRLVFWKLLASSLPALISGFDKAKKRLQGVLEGQEELAELNSITEYAENITQSARSKAFIEIVCKALIELHSNNCEERIIVFSENTVTLQYLFTLLKEYKFPVTLCTHGNEERAIRSFKRTSKILLTTDSFAQSYDIPFCSCVINYDVPWSIQKLERRIACCHTYGQKYDVLVYNFIDPTNRADRRLYTVVNKKLKQFDAVFGVSETILGEIVTDIDSLVGEVRSLEDIQEEQEAFIKKYQKEIADDSSRAANDLLAHFDEEVAKKFSFYNETLLNSIQHAEDTLWELTTYALHGKATLNDEERSITVSLAHPPFKGIRLSRMDFRMGRNIPRGERYTFTSPLAKAVLSYCLDGELQIGYMKVQAGSGFTSGMRGIIGLWQGYFISSVEHSTKAILCGYSDDYELSYDECDRILQLSVIQCSGGFLNREDSLEQEKYDKLYDEKLHIIQERILSRWREEKIQEQNKALQEELQKLDIWLEEEIEHIDIVYGDLDKKQKSVQSQIGSINRFSEKLKMKKQIANIEKHKSENQAKKKEKIQEAMSRKEQYINEAKQKTYFQCGSRELFICYFEIE